MRWTATEGLGVKCRLKHQATIFQVVGQGQQGVSYCLPKRCMEVGSYKGRGADIHKHGGMKRCHRQGRRMEKLSQT